MCVCRTPHKSKNPGKQYFEKERCEQEFVNESCRINFAAEIGNETDKKGEFREVFDEGCQKWVIKGVTYWRHLILYRTIAT